MKTNRSKVADSLLIEIVSVIGCDCKMKAFLDILRQLKKIRREVFVNKNDFFLNFFLIICLKNKH
jgi:hypothetical protein